MTTQANPISSAASARRRGFEDARSSMEQRRYVRCRRLRRCSVSSEVTAHVTRQIQLAGHDHRNESAAAPLAYCGQTRSHSTRPSTVPMRDFTSRRSLAGRPLTAIGRRAPCGGGTPAAPDRAGFAVMVTGVAIRRT